LSAVRDCLLQELITFIFLLEVSGVFCPSIYIAVVSLRFSFQALLPNILSIHSFIKVRHSDPNNSAVMSLDLQTFTKVCF